MNGALDRLWELTETPLQHPLSNGQREQLADDLHLLLSADVAECGAAIRLQFVAGGRPSVAYPDAYSSLEADRMIIRDVRSLIGQVRTPCVASH